MYDYVIVGAGSAGCVLANRLSEDPSIRVLVLEAGGKDRSPNIKIPAAFAKQFHTRLDWDFATEPEPHVDDRSLYIPRGKSLGGSSSMNAMLYVRGRPLDYDLWEQQGATRLGLERCAAVLLEVRGQRPRRVGAPRDGRSAAGLRAALAARVGRPAAAAGERSRRHPAHRRLQRARAGRRLDVPGQPVRRQALERRRRLPETGAGAAEPRGPHGRARARRRARGRPRGRACGSAAGAGASR